jgi:hypothetical protein
MCQLKYIPIMFAVILSACSLLCSSPGTAAEKDNKKLSFARTSLESYVNNALSAENVGNFGFSSMGDAKRAELGDAYPVLSLDLQGIKNYREGDSVASLKTNTETTWFPVKASGEVVAKLEILEKGNQMIAGEFGAASEARRITQVLADSMQTWKSRGMDDPLDMKIFRIPYMKADFVFLAGPQGEYLIPAMPLPGRYDLKNGDLHPAVEVLSRMKKYAQEIEEGMIR